MLATTLSIVAVFLPIGFMGGIVGKFFHEFGMTIVAAVLISMFVSFTLDPMLSSVWHDPQVDAHGARGGRAGHALRPHHRPRHRLRSTALTECARATATSASCAGRWRTSWPPLGIALATFVGSFFMVPLLGTEFVPKADFSETQVNFYTPVGSSLEVTEARARQVDAVAARAARGALHASPPSTAAAPPARSTASIYVRLVDRKDRTRSVDRAGGAAARAAARASPASPSPTSA